MQAGENGPLPTLIGAGFRVPELAYTTCPGKGLDYPTLAMQVFGTAPQNWLIGVYRSVYLGYSLAPEIRRRAASGGVITQTLIYLLEQKLIQGAVVVRQGQPKPWLAAPVIATTAAEIRAASQSVYAPVPVNTLLPEMAAFPGRLAFVGLPDQVASLRRLQGLGHPGALKVDYVLGPYVGTNLYTAAIASYLRSQGVKSLEEVAELRYREGEWPGYLQVRTRDGRLFRTEKFYYNYLIPFYVTRSTLYSVDFTNELTDISVGDAWHPRLETKGGGFSVVVARSPRGERLLHAMQAAGQVALAAIELDEALAMHGHMLDFKKRGSFIRMQWRKARGLPAPEYGYEPAHIPASRYAVELVISLLFRVGRTHLARRVIEHVPIAVLGPLFNTARKRWKQLSKPVKRKGLAETHFVVRSE
jgi:coenzyme F420 hydrogenase subunit beta